MHVDTMTNPTGQHIVPDEARDGKPMRFVSKAFHPLNVMTYSVRAAAISQPMKGAYIGPPPTHTLTTHVTQLL
jgi:hypothetical protein